MSLLKIMRLGLISTRCYSIFKDAPSVLAIELKKNKHYYEDKRYYKNFGHKPEKEPNISKAYYTLLLVMFIIPSINYKWIKQLLSVKAESETIEEGIGVESKIEENNDDEVKKRNIAEKKLALGIEK